MKNREKISGIYRIYCKANDKSYYGQTSDYNKRVIDHKKQLRHVSKNKHHCVHLQNAWNLYGESEFEFLLVETCNPEQLNEREQWYFDTYGPTGKLFNTSLCAESTRRGVAVSEETKQKLRELNTGPNNPNWGRHLTDEHKRRISESHSGVNHWHYGRPCTEEEKLKNSLSLSGENAPLAKLNWEQVRQIRKEFCQGIITVKDVSEKYGMNKSTICDMLKNITWKDKLYNELPALKILEQGIKILNLETVQKIREDYKTDKYDFEQLSQKYGLSVSGVGKVIRNETWEDPVYKQWIIDNRKPHKKPVRINMDIAQQIREDFKNKINTIGKEQAYIQIGENHNLSPVTVRKIIKNKLWIVEENL